MTGLKTWTARFFGDETGATSIEYALIATCVSIVIVVAVNSIGVSVNGMFAPVQAALQ